jgi:hypothetical protein
MGRPTEEADAYFRMGASRFQSAMNSAAKGGDTAAKGGDTMEYNLAMGYLDMCTGLLKLNVGLRATYMLLEEVKTTLQRPR